MRETLTHLDFSIFAQMSLILFGGVFLGVLIRVIQTPRKEVDTLARMAIDKEDAEMAVAERGPGAGGRP